jgi:hypothetical protein
MKRIRCFMVLFNIILVQTFPQTPDHNGSGTTGKKRPLIAGAETLFTNVLFIGITGLILD